MSIATWYTHQYQSWNRTRRLATTPFIARTGTHASQAALAMAHNHNQQLQLQPGQVPLHQPGQLNQPATLDASKEKKTAEPLFGPSIGPVGNGPSWTLSSEKKVVTDELTPDIVNGWIEKSKEPSQPTTTLQALVNLKRPTLRLSPLTSIHEPDHDPSDPSSEPMPMPAEQLHHHGLEFEYDCDAPKCGIYVHVHLPKSHPDAPAAGAGMPGTHGLAKLLVFETVVEGGFGRRLTLEEGAMLELGRFEHVHAHANAASNGEKDSAQLQVSAEPSTSGDQNQTNADATTARNRRRFTHFHFRKRSQNRSISGPALAVVDAEPAAAQDPQSMGMGMSGGMGKGGKEGKDEVAEEGVKVTIRLAALDEMGTELASPNEQITYLHIVRFGAKPEPAGGEGESEQGEDTRPWVVRVVKREATIGPHTFQLHEIFGLTSTSTHPTAPTAPPPNATSTPHTYPPESEKSSSPPPALPTLTLPIDEDSPQSECLLCLSSPREVVLLPCRHLVACKDCALNMVEFGAGGNITQSVETPTGGEEGGANAGGGGGGGANGTNANPAPVVNTRRKRKAKGWFCPVCRQPYTSMLRLTTTPPPLPESKEGENSSGTEDEGMPTVGLNNLSLSNAPANPTSTANGPNANASNANSRAPSTAEARSGGLLGGALRPAFLRGLSLSRNGGNHGNHNHSAAPDVENQISTAA